MNRIKTALLLVLALVFIQCNSKEEKAETKPETVKEFQTQSVLNDTIQSTVNLTGRIIPTKQVNIVAEVQGVIKSTGKNFEDGERYRKGQLIISIDDTELRYSLRSQRSKFINTLVQSMSDIELDYPNEFSNWNTFLKSVNPESSLPTLPAQTSEQLRFFLSGRGVFDTYYNIKSQENRLSKYRLYAPFDGVVTQASVDVGDLVSPGARLGEFISTASYEVVTAVSPSDLTALKSGQKFQLYARSIDKNVTATVKRISENLDATTQSINVYLSVKDSQLKSGMYVEGALATSAFAKAIRIPKKLISRDNKVYLIKDETVITKPVTVAAVEEDTAIIQGLDNGDVLIIEQVKPSQLGTKAKAK
ncbi:MAG: efflux RND transporter periplasmic adaptor subunit [Bacteroidota bacterium]